MAATKKALEIQEKKRQMRAEYRAVIDQIKAACQRVPKIVIEGSAQLAVAWRDSAERGINLAADLPRSASIGEMENRIKVVQNELQWLCTPMVDPKTGARS